MTKNIFIIAAATLLAIFLYGQIDYLDDPFSGMDLKYYRQMADASPSLASDIPRPFSYRILGPWIAGLAGEGKIEGFLVLTVVSSLALVILMYKVMLSMKISPSASVIAVIVFIFSKHLFGTGNWNFFQVKDTVSMALMAGSLLAIYRKKYLLLALLLAAGSLAGELTLLMIPVLAVYLIERGRPCRETLKALGWCIPAVVVFITIRLALPATGGMGLFEAAAHYGQKLRFPMVWFGLLINPFIPMTLAPLVMMRETSRFIRENLHLAALFLLVLVSASFGSNNERLMAPAAPAFYALVAYLLDSPEGRSKWLRVILVVMAILAGTHHTIARFPLPSRSYTVALSLAALGIVTIVFILVRYRSGQSSSQSGSGLGEKSSP